MRFELRTDAPELWFTHSCNGTYATTRLPLSPTGWAVATEEPLTVTPSVHCTDCGTHGSLTDGAWVPCPAVSVESA